MAVYKYKTKSGYKYMYKFCSNYQQFLKRGFLTKKEALEAEYKARLLPSIKLTFMEAVNLFCDKKKQQLKITTYVALERILNRYIKPYFKDMFISKIDLNLISRWRLKIDNLNLTIKYKNSILGTLKNIFEYLTMLGYVNTYQYNLIFFRDDTIRINRTSKRYISVDEFIKFYSVIDVDMFRILFKLAYLTGCRISEIRALSVEAVKDGGVYIYKSASSRVSNGKTNILPTKSITSNRFIPLHEDFYNELILYIKVNELVEGNYLFHGINKNYPIGEMTINRARKEYIIKSGVDYFIFHDFRHSVASILAEDGENLNNVALFLGQSSKAVTEKYYLIQRDETKVKIANRLYEKIAKNDP